MSQFESLLSTDTVEKLCFRRGAIICRAVGWRIEKRFGGDAEVDVEVAGDHSSRIGVALSTDFRSECHLDEILLQSVFGVFQQYRPKAALIGRLCTMKFTATGFRLIGGTAPSFVLRACQTFGQLGCLIAI
jgi:hypothetical protein